MPKFIVTVFITMYASTIFDFDIIYFASACRESWTLCSKSPVVKYHQSQEFPRLLRFELTLPSPINPYDNSSFYVGVHMDFGLH